MTNRLILVPLIVVGIIFTREILHYASEALTDWRYKRLGPQQYLPEGWHSSQGARLGAALAAQRKERQ